MALKKLFNSDEHNCFACSPSNPYGLHLELFTDESIVMSKITLPEHFSGWHRVVHGGILATLLDEIMGWAGLYLLRQVTLTKEMTIEFAKAAYVGESLEVVGRVVRISGKRNAEIEGVITRNSGEICAKARGDFTTLSPKLAIRFGIMTESQQRHFLEPLFKQNPEYHA
jgi:uncharacterized protein (TIGR00369 family)